MNGIPIQQEGPAPSPGTFSVELQRAVGCLCEVRKLDNALVFLGRISAFDGRAITVLPTGGKEAPPVIYNDTFKLVLHITGEPALSWTGKICGSTRSFWRLDHMIRCHFREQRTAFRQTVNLRANVLCINALYPDATPHADQLYARLCRVMDVSLGGIQLRGQDLYRPGDHLLLMNLWLIEGAEQPFVFTTCVRWSEQISRMECRYGCAFERMNIRDEDRLCAAILELQRSDIADRQK